MAVLLETALSLRPHGNGRYTNLNKQINVYIICLYYISVIYLCIYSCISRWFQTLSRTNLNLPSSLLQAFFVHIIPTPLSLPCVPPLRASWLKVRVSHLKFCFIFLHFSTSIKTLCRKIHYYYSNISSSVCMWESLWMFYMTNTKIRECFLHVLRLSQERRKIFVDSSSYVVIFSPVCLKNRRKSMSFHKNAVTLHLHIFFNNTLHKHKVGDSIKSYGVWVYVHVLTFKTMTFDKEIIITEVSCP